MAVTSVALSRLRQELKSHDKDPTPGITAGPINDNLMHWQAAIAGPEGTPYEGGLFQLDLVLPDNYPYAPPKIRFTTRVYHPNISENGSICLDILKLSEWSPALTIPKVLLSITSLLNDPNPKDPLVPGIARQLQTDKAGFLKAAKEWTSRFAMPMKEEKETEKPTRKKKK